MGSGFPPDVIVRIIAIHYMYHKSILQQRITGILNAQIADEEKWGNYSKIFSLTRYEHMFIIVHGKNGDFMPRPRCLRRICCVPGVTYFKPAGIPLRLLEEVVVTLDEVEALRLADLEGMYQEKAAARMNISRPTFSRLIESAHKKVAEALVKGKALRLEGGDVIMKGGITMPQRDALPAGRQGTGPARTRQGLGLGPCGCGQRRGFGRRRGGARNRAASPQGDSGLTRPSGSVETGGKDRTENGGQKQ
jgi:uncharacterized protein